MTVSPRNILCAIDFSEFTHLVISYGQALAEKFNSRLTLCHVVSNMVMISSAGQAYVASEKLEAERRQDAVTRLESMASKLRVPCETRVVTGHPADELARIAREIRADLMVAATYGGSGVKRFLIGSVTDRLLKTLDCTMMVIHVDKIPDVLPADTSKLFNRILVGCDFSPDSALALTYGLHLARKFDAELHLAHVTPGTSGEAASHRAEHQRLTQQLAQLLPLDTGLSVPPVTTILEGVPYQELISLGRKKQIDLIVLGVRGHGLLEKFLVGSTTDRVITRAGCPVLAVRQPSDTPIP